MTGRGRPLRFLAIVTTGWVGLRIGTLWWASGSLPEAIREVLPFAAVSTPGPRLLPLDATPFPDAPRAHALPAAARAPIRRVRAPVLLPSDPIRVQFALLGLLQYGAPEPMGGAAAAPAAAPLTLPAVFPGIAAPPSARRWSASGWIVVRGGDGVGAAPAAGQLGGGQAGLRIAWRPFSDARFALIGRATAPLRGRGREAAIAAEWQPAARAPVRIAAELRLPLDGGPAAPGIGLVGGESWGLGAGFRLEGYGQAGMVKRARVEPYADGALRMTRPVARAGRATLGLGGGVWGAAQRDAARLDIGPGATLDLPVGGRNFRLAADWRERVAGDARPGSGAVLTLGADF